MRSAIWGTGNIAHAHAQALKAAGAQLVAVVDREEEKAKDFAMRWGALKYGCDEAVLFSDEIAVVHVCTPPNLHYEMVKKLLQHNKHVLCEKPLCFDNQQARELARLAQESGCICAVNFNVRYHMACQKAKQVVDSLDFGPVMLVHGSYLQEFNAFPAPLDWRYDPVLAGRMRAVTEIGSHWVDIAQYISGKKILAVSALFGRFNPVRGLEDGVMYPREEGKERPCIEIVSEDAACVNIKFEDGAIGSMTLSEVSQGRINRIELEVTGQNKNLWWNSEENNHLHTAQKGGGINTEVFGFGNGFADTFRALVDQYYAAVQQGSMPDEPNFPDFSEGAKIVEICNGILKSADEDGRWVSVAL